MRPGVMAGVPTTEAVTAVAEAAVTSTTLPAATEAGVGLSDPRQADSGCNH